MTAFAYAAPTSVSEVLTLLDDHSRSGEPTQILAGGTDVMVQMRSVNREPRTIIDIKRLEETNRLEVGAEHIYIGSAVPSAQMQEHAELKALYPGLLEAADLIGSTQVQGRATVCGNLCNASPAGDSIPRSLLPGQCVILRQRTDPEACGRGFCDRGRPKCLSRRRIFVGGEVATSSGFHERCIPALYAAYGNGHCSGRSWRISIP